MDKVSCGSHNCDYEGSSSPYCSSGLKLCGTSLTNAEMVSRAIIIIALGGF